MKAMFESLKLFIKNAASYVIALVRVSLVTPLKGDEVSDAEALARDCGTDTDADLGQAGIAYGSPQRRTKHPGYVTSNGRGSLEVGRGR